MTPPPPHYFRRRPPPPLPRRAHHVRATTNIMRRDPPPPTTTRLAFAGKSRLLWRAMAAARGVVGAGSLSPGCRRVAVALVLARWKAGHRSNEPLCVKYEREASRPNRDPHAARSSKYGTNDAPTSTIVVGDPTRKDAREPAWC